MKVNCKYGHLQLIASMKIAVDNFSRKLKCHWDIKAAVDHTAL